MDDCVPTWSGETNVTANAFYPYPAYKPSGVPWLGDVPEHWEDRRGWLDTFRNDGLGSGAG